MMNSVSNTGNVPAKPETGGTHMTDSQKISFQNIISVYDPDNFSREDFFSLGEELHNAGINPSHEVRTLLEESGFNVKEYAPPHGSKGPDGTMGPPQRRNNLDSQTLQSLFNILSSFDLANLSTDDEQILMDRLTNSGILKQGLIVNITT